jgi:hypothetical protein
MRRLLMTIPILALGPVATALRAAEEPIVLHVAPNGNDEWSGRLPEPNAAGTDGPLATLMGARDAVRRLRAAGGQAARPVTIEVRGGVYRMAEPFVLELQDSGTAEAPVRYAARRGERPVLSGGRVIGGWERGQGGVWSARVPEVAEGRWHFRQLFVNGKRRTRARSPNEGYYYIVRKAPPRVEPATGK